MATITCIEDLRKIYERRVPRMFYDYTETGSWSEGTFQRNTGDFGELMFRQRVAKDMSNRSLATKMVGQDVTMPVGLAPVGLTGMQSADGEIKAARAAHKFGVPYTLSTMSVCSMEDVAEHAQVPFWFQVYTLVDDEFMANLIGRARAVECPVLVVTLDLQVLGQRHKDIKNGLSVPPKLTMRSIANLATKVPWGLEMLRTPRRGFGNLIGHAKGVSDMSSLSTWTQEAFDPALDWEKVARIRDQWGGKMVLKGIMDPEDAARAAELGVEAIVVSNHGGRQLDGAPSAIRVLPQIVREVGERVEILFDSGIRSGQDALKALALGAKGTFIGRAYVYGLGAMGEAGVTRALEVIQKELDLSMALCGHRRIEDVTRDILIMPEGFGIEVPS